MSVEQPWIRDPRMQQALDELRGVIAKQYPEATFAVSRGEDDPDSVHLTTIVDVDDTDAVLDVVVDRLLQFQVEEQLPVHVIPIRPIERILHTARPKRLVSSHVFEERSR